MSSEAKNKALVRKFLEEVWREISRSRRASTSRSSSSATINALKPTQAHRGKAYISAQTKSLAAMGLCAHLLASECPKQT